MRFERVKGTYDMLPPESHLFLKTEKIIRETIEEYGFLYARTSVLQPMEMFKRAVGGETDIVNKEMFSIKSRSGKDYALKPEETAPLMRTVIEGNSAEGSKMLKLYYFTTLYRYDRPQKGRYREFFQYGVETINSADFRRDCELILLGRSILGRFGIKDYTVELNSIGCRACRGDYVKILKDYLDSRSSELCPVCKVRKDSNTLRVLDCKEEGCRRVVNDAPKITKHLCGECGSDFDSLKSMLDSFDLKYNVNPLIVRGLDYYTKTVFEFVERGESLGSQSTLIGGGRYDLLSEELGGRPLPSCGFAGGVERLLLSIPAEEKKIMGELPAIDAFIVHFGGETLNAAFSLAQGLRSEGVRAEIMFESPKPKKQLSSASERSRYAVIIGENELAKNTVTVKDMKTQEQRELPLDAGLLAKFVRRGENA